jgi:hypothetical protein
MKGNTGRVLQYKDKWWDIYRCDYCDREFIIEENSAKSMTLCPHCHCSVRTCCSSSSSPSDSNICSCKNCKKYEVCGFKPDPYMGTCSTGPRYHISHKDFAEKLFLLYGKHCVWYERVKSL